MQIIKQKSSQIILLRHEELPFALLTNGKYAQMFMQRYNFSRIDPIQDPSGAVSGLLFSNGLYEEDGTEFAITRLIVENRKVTISIEGASSYVEKMWEQIREALLVLIQTDDKDYLKPILISNESELLVILDFPASNLFSSPVTKFFQEKVVESTSSNFATSHIGSSGINFSIDYTPKTDQLNDRRINLVRKEFSIKTAVGYPVSDQVYSSAGPIDIDTHIQLLQRLEDDLK